MANEERHDRFRDTINVPIAIPAWGALSLIAGALFTAGTLYQKMDSLIETSKRNDTQVSVIREKQIVNTAILETLQQNSKSTESRLATLERALFERSRNR